MADDNTKQGAPDPSSITQTPPSTVSDPATEAAPQILQKSADLEAESR